MMKPMLSGLPWAQIETMYKSFQQKSREFERRRIELLAEIRRQQPWKDKSRYATRTVFEKYAYMSWTQVVKDRLEADIVEVENSIRVLENFGPDALETYGRAALYRILSRTEDKQLQEKILRKMDECSSKIGRPVSASTVVRIISQIVPKKPVRTTNTIGLFEKLKSRNAELESRLHELETIISSCARCSKIAKGDVERRAKAS